MKTPKPKPKRKTKPYAGGPVKCLQRLPTHRL
jgi:hypothetical protein